MSKTRKFAAAAALLLALGAGCAPGPGWIPENSPDIMSCQEDDPCWDCETMGNHVCGNDPAEVTK